tara:strand:- start:6316 stop:6987 length:672 start_codon:yes stop_codon:yes gene_type:complete
MYLYIKRILDIFFSLLALILLSPFLIPIAFILKITGEGEIFYLQKRIGKGGDYFHIYKFATMIKNSPNIGTGIYTAKNDPRILPFGRFLRFTKINELPQILNILFGDMSIVGPRPLIEKTYNLYSEEVKQKINNILPGLSGIGSLAFRDEESLLESSGEELEVFYSNKIAPYKGKLEIWYCEKISLYIDIVVVFLTFWLIIFPNSNLLYSLFNDLPKKPDFFK